MLGQARPNTFVFESSALIKATGFREYAARWWFGHADREKKPELNLIGVQAIGMALRTLIGRIGVVPDTITGHYLHNRHLEARCQTRRCHSWLGKVGAFLLQPADRARLGRRAPHGDSCLPDARPQLGQDTGGPLSRSAADLEHPDNVAPLPRGGKTRGRDTCGGIHVGRDRVRQPCAGQSRHREWVRVVAQTARRLWSEPC